MSEVRESERERAIEYHQKMMREGAPPYRLGLYYRHVLEVRLWPTQSETAHALGVSQSQISKALSISGLPKKVVAVFGETKITFRLGAQLQRLVALFGMDALSKNIASFPTRAVTTEEALTWLARGALPENDAKARLSLIDNGRAIRLDISHAEGLLPLMESIEDAVATHIALGSGGFTNRRLDGRQDEPCHVIKKRRYRKSVK